MLSSMFINSNYRRKGIAKELLSRVVNETHIMAVPNIYLEEGGKVYDASILIDNSIAIAMCNRVGAEGDMHFSGESIAVDACGNVIAKADDNEQILYVDIDLHESNKIRERKHYTNLRRIDLYK